MDSQPTAESGTPQRSAGPASPAAFLVLDTESVPDGDLIQSVKFADLHLAPDEAIAKAQEEARQLSPTGSDFLPVTFQVPVAACVLSVAADFTIQRLACLDTPQFRPEEITRQFWRGVGHHKRAKLVTFNGRGFDLPLLELAGFRFGCSARDYFQNSRARFGGNHLDLCDWLGNYGASRLPGGLNLLAKLLGKPGKMDIAGDQVYGMYRAGRIREINDYCMFDTLDTYFVFLRTRVLMGDLDSEKEREKIALARDWLEAQAEHQPALKQYLDGWKQDGMGNGDAGMGQESAAMMAEGGG